MNFNKGDLVEIVAGHPEELIGSIGIVVGAVEGIHGTEGYDIIYAWGTGMLEQACAPDGAPWWTATTALRKIGHVEGIDG